MLEKLFEEIQKNGTCEIRQLAKKLDVSVEMVESMIHYLIQTGKVQPYQTCIGACGVCSLKNDCNTDTGSDNTSSDIKLFTYTQR